MARKFFFVSAGLLCLTLAVHLHMSPAQAQSGSLEVAEAGTGIYAGAVGRTVYLASQTAIAGPLDLVRSFAPVPGSSPISAVAATGVSSVPVTVMLRDGDVYTATDGGSSWNLAGNIFSGAPTPTQRETWGQLKYRYPPNRGTARPGAGDR
jgi:hypothetical protein